MVKAAHFSHTYTHTHTPFIKKLEKIHQKLIVIILE